MKAFAVNLISQTEKKAHILSECAKHNIDVEVINAVHGEKLSPELLHSLVYDYPACCLTLGEIGCALSHLSIYQKMIDEQHQLALVLEDDVILDESINDVLQAIEILEINNLQPQIYLLSPPNIYLESFKKPLTEHHTLHKIIHAYGTYAYVLNLAAAKSLSAFLNPIKYESDRWTYFQQMEVVHIDCVIPAVASTNDQDSAASNLEVERSKIMKARGDYFRVLRRKEMSLKEKTKKILWKILIAMKLVKTINAVKKTT